jgi:hypothetical protein
MPCDATCAPEVFLFDAKGVCFLATATRVWARTIRFDCILDGIPGTPVDPARPFRIYWRQHGLVCRPQAKPHRGITASHCTRLRSPEPELKGAPMRIALMSTYEVLAQLLETYRPPPYRIRHARVAIQSGRNEGQTRAIAASITRFHVSVVIEPHPAVESANSSTLFRRTYLEAQCRLRGMNDRSMITNEIRHH